VQALAGSSVVLVTAQLTSTCSTSVTGNALVMLLFATGLTPN
jgi:hypothetical protein